MLTQHCRDRSGMYLAFVFLYRRQRLWNEELWFIFLFYFPRSFLHRQLKPRNVLSLAWSYVHIPDSRFHNTASKADIFTSFCFCGWCLGKFMWSNPPSPDMFFYKIFWSLIQLLALTSSALWMSKEKKINKKLNRKKHHGVSDREITFSNYSTRSPTSLNLSEWWLHRFVTPLNGFLCCQPFRRDLLHLPPQPLSAFQKNLHLQWNRGMHLQMTFYSQRLHPGSSRLTAGITIHYVSAGRKKRLQRAREKLAPYFTIETCQWNNLLALTRCQGVFTFIFYFTLVYKTGICLENTDPGFRARVPCH